MTPPRDPDRQIHAFLPDGRPSCPTRSFDAVRDRIEQHDNGSSSARGGSPT